MPDAQRLKQLAIVEVGGLEKDLLLKSVTEELGRSYILDIIRRSTSMQNERDPWGYYRGIRIKITKTVARGGLRWRIVPCFGT